MTLTAIPFEETIQKIREWFIGPYLNPAGIPYYAIDGHDGTPVGERNLLPELDDYAPFFWLLDDQAFVNCQIEHLKQCFKKNPLLFTHPQIRMYAGLGLPGPLRRWVPHVDSQDFVEILFGLQELAELTGRADVLELALGIWSVVLNAFNRQGFLMTWRFPLAGWTMPLADAMAGMFIEIAAGFSRLSGDSRHFELALGWMKSWRETPFFTEFKLFPSVHANGLFGRIPAVRRRMSSGELAKSNTSMASGCIALASPPFGNRDALEMVRSWVGGVRRHFLTPDGVLAHFPRLREQDPWGPVLSTNFAAIDIFCDLYHITGESEYLDLAVSIADFFLKHQSVETGLFPDEIGGGVSYLDGNTDLAVSLRKLFELTGNRSYLTAGERALSGIIMHHTGPHGFYRDVGLDSGDVVNPVVETRFVSLMLKPLLLYKDNLDIYGDHGRWSLFRDR